MSILGRANRRHFVRHPLQLILAILGVALGVAMVVSIDLAAKSTHRAFALSMEALTGRYTHHLTGGPMGIPESLFTRLRVEAGLRETAPAVEGYIGLKETTCHLIGFDVFSERNLRSRFVNAARGEEGMRLLTEPNTVLLSAVSAQRLGLKPGDELKVMIDNRPHQLILVGYAEGSMPPDPVLEGVMLADITTAQELLGRVGWLDRIDLVLGEDPSLDMKINALLPEGVELISAAGRQSATQNMTAAFELNLRAMSLLALLVGSFLIYNTMAFSVLQRRELLASLRVLGATSRQLLSEILWEAAALGLFGGLVGMGFGVLAARVLLHMVTRTINDIYFVLTVTEFMMDPWVLVYGVFLGMIIAVLAALGPAIEASLTSPIMTRARSGVEGSARRAIPWLAMMGVLALLVATGLFAVNLEGLVPAIAGVFLLLLGYGLLSPVFLLGGVWVLGALGRVSWGWLIRLAVRSIGATISRSGLAIAALTIAIAVSIGVGTMIDSFRGSIAEWLDQILQADIYIAMPASTPRLSPPLPDGLAERLGSIPGVDRVSSGRRVFVSTSKGESELLALDPPYLDQPGFRFKDSDGKDLWAHFPELRGVFISEPYAQRHRLAVGDRLVIKAGKGSVTLPVAGIFFDYRSDQGLIVIHRRLYNELWQDPTHTSLGVYLKPGADLSDVRSELDRRLSDLHLPLSVRSNREIRDISLETFERTFAITQVLRLLAVGVAFIGIVSALMALQYERRREMAVLRATGLTPWQAGGLVLLQTGFMGLMAGLLALPLGLMVALALVRVINLRSFGWTMDLSISVWPLILAVGMSVLAALLAGAYPARLAMRTSPAQGLREE